MSGRILSHGTAVLVRRSLLSRQLHSIRPNSVGGLLRTQRVSLRGRPWPVQASFVHNAVATRSIAFARILPKLALKMVRLPAMFGGAMVAGMAYVQYQAVQMGTYTMDVFSKAGETASDFAHNILINVNNAAERTSQGWQKKKDEFELPEWAQKIFRLEEYAQTNSETSSGGGGGPPKKNRIGPGAAAAAMGMDATQEHDESDPTSNIEESLGDQMMVLTKKMIEIRNILHRVGQSETLTLPSIVVIGSQSSGKSSVLEALVGHEFLPKGSNMVTRRPIELTLVNTPHSQSEYGEFPALGLGKITDFSNIQRTLTDLNLAVPEKDCVSDEPIQLQIYSPNVPDLSLIDLPGYIQVAGHGQPRELKQRISELCDKYIQSPNVILAISAADVDLANSTALRASRRVDPRGERTIGVITKMDLVDPERGASILDDKKYPLRLGYVGVVCRLPPTTSLFTRGSANIRNAIVKNERAYFNAHPEEFGPDSGLAVGTTTLQQKLMRTLEQSMAANLSSTRDAISQELEEATYEFKVQYNDRPLSAESYLAESLDSFKHSFKGFSENFGRREMRELLKSELDQQVLNILAQRYWNKPIDDLSRPLYEPDPLEDLPKSDPNSLYWHRKLDASSSSLTKLGIGRLATTVVANAIQNRIDDLVASSTFTSHPYAQKAITESALTILNDRFFSTSDQVENCVKPFKFEIEVENNEWAGSRENVQLILKEELRQCDASLKHVESIVGRRKLKDVTTFVDKVRKGDVVLEGDGSGGAGGFSSSLLQRGREALFLQNRADLIKMRIMAVKSKQCKSLKNKYFCPEIFLDAVADKLTSTAVLFLNVELLSEFYYHFPRELDIRLGRHLSEEEVDRFAREDPRIRKHLDVIKNKELLELALQKIESLRQLEGRSKATGSRPPPIKKDHQRSWRLF